MKAGMFAVSRCLIVFLETLSTIVTHPLFSISYASLSSLFVEDFIIFTILFLACYNGCSDFLERGIILRKPLIAGNWKMYKTIGEAVETVTQLKAKVSGVKDKEILVCPVFTSLKSVCDVLKGTNIHVGAQDLFWEEKGAFTGEVSAQMIKDTGCTHVIIGHSERRQYFHETNETVGKKTLAALKVALTPIVCVGEKLDERESGKTFAVCEKQIREGLSVLSKEQAAKIVLAYEPVWAIGTGKVATPAQAEEVHIYIRKTIASLFGNDIADGMRILYGGSVKPENVAELMGQSNIDGALVGGASLEADSFAKLVTY
jgi:triosephosphate isomerase (TIM)